MIDAGKINAATDILLALAGLWIATRLLLAHSQERVARKDSDPENQRQLALRAAIVRQLAGFQHPAFALFIFAVTLVKVGVGVILICGDAGGA